jgi:hypothetical protein
MGRIAEDEPAFPVFHADDFIRQAVQERLKQVV